MKKAIATISRTNEILQKYGLYAKKNYGQNFIIEPSIVEKIAQWSEVDQESSVIEIGPGIGALTEQLAKLAKKVIAFEIDDRLIEVLAETLADYQNVEIIHQDFLKTDIIETVNRLKKHSQKVVVCANLPYYITTPILFALFESKSDLSAITVMMQKEVADRFSASVSTKDYNALSVIVQYLYDVKIVMKIPKTIFNPKPTIDSAVVRFKPKKDLVSVDNEQAFFEMVKSCFKQRRKTILNNYKETLLDKKKAVEILERANIDPSWRAQDCTLMQFIHLYEVQNETKSVCED